MITFFEPYFQDLLIQKSLALTVITSENGWEFLAKATERLRGELPIKLAILDILMYPLNGISTAMAFRAIEKGFALPSPTPVLFLSAVRLDNDLRKAIAHCQPALYLNKGIDSTPDRLGMRIERMVNHFLR